MYLYQSQNSPIRIILVFEYLFGESLSSLRNMQCCFTTTYLYDYICNILHNMYFHHWSLLYTNNDLRIDGRDMHDTHDTCTSSQGIEKLTEDLQYIS